jgi:hypothetical protein
LSEDEFKAVLAGEVNPFSLAAEPPRQLAANVTVPIPVIATPESSEWGSYLQEMGSGTAAKAVEKVTIQPVQAKVITKIEPLVMAGEEGESSALDGDGPICLDEYDADNTVCTQDCAHEGFMKACMKTKALNDAKEAKAKQKRQAVRGLVK